MRQKCLVASATNCSHALLNKAVVEQDHRAIKRIIKPMMGFKDFRCARIIVSGIEIAHMIRKGQMYDDGVASTAAEQFYSLVM
ncbi:DDE-type integrase/transposase/recombinase [Paraburkholderia sp. BR14320]|uniref:DDE-type integrase/transposase/recombinase n=1 Tax=unclassified Paraburkholderia TaxID=2615204 RepID=UPI0034CF4B96